MVTTRARARAGADAPAAPAATTLAAPPKRAKKAPAAAAAKKTATKVAKPAPKKPATTKAPPKRAPRKRAETPAKENSPVEENPFGDFPNYPSTPAVNPMADFPQYPNTPAVNPLAEFPQYPNTPAVNPLAEFPQYPNTPAVNPLAEFPQYPNTPAVNPLAEFPQYPNTPAVNPLAEFPQYPNTPAVNPLAEFPTYPSTAAQPTVALAETPEQPSSKEASPKESSPKEQSPAPRPDMLQAPFLQAPTRQALVFQAPSANAVVPTSPYKSALRSPQKLDTKTPKKTVSFKAHCYTNPDSEFFNADGPLADTIFFCDIQSKGRDQNHLFISLLEDLGARVAAEWTHETVGITHVLFKEGSAETLKKVAATHGEVKCVDLGFAMDCEKHNKRLDEADYAVDLNPASHAKPEPKRHCYTPARTPSKFFGNNTPSTTLSTPTTPTSSEYDRSILLEDKENTKPSPLWKPIQRTCPPKPQLPPGSAMRFFQQIPIKPHFSMVFDTPSKPKRSLLQQLPDDFQPSRLKQSPFRPPPYRSYTAMPPTRKRNFDDTDADDRSASRMPKKLCFA